MSPQGTARRVGEGAARWLRRFAARRTLPRTGPFWVSLELAAPVTDVPGRFARERAETLLGVLETLEAIADEPRARGILLQLRGAPGGIACAQSLRRALDAVRARGKAVAAWAESLDLVSLYLASAADRLWIPETGRVFAVGLRADAYYLRDLLARIDVRPEIVRIGSHKSAGEMFTNQRMSDEQREQVEAIVSDGFDALVEGIAAGRARTTDEVREWIDRGRYTAADARSAGLVDGFAYRDELEDRVGELASRRASAPARPPLVEARALWALRTNARAGIRAQPRIAVLFASGAISRGERARGIASRAAEEMLGALARDARVRGVVLRIDSPGGDALASDLLWRAVRALRREKPVVASIAEVAASGGYYLASAADCVLAERSSITGSIGVIGGKLDLSGLFQRFGVGLDAVERGARAGMHSAARGFTEEERELVRAEMRSLYETFVARVAEGRGLAAAAVERAAEGRVFTGDRALALGLIDALGGPLEALAEVRRRAGLRGAEPVRIDLHPRVSVLRALSHRLR
ncbi:MAG TPA: signal peptide peptidase SppA [Myxococcota bacterium]|nr:signal peptide peptidase SppA [Myxococcota bacterium]